MLACLSPTAPFAEETVNTLHFASVALRIKAEPVLLLDPQVGGEGGGRGGEGWGWLRDCG